MNTHKNARLTFVRRLEMVRQITELKLTPCAVSAAAQGVRETTARKWLARYLACGDPAFDGDCLSGYRCPIEVEFLGSEEASRRSFGQAPNYVDSTLRTIEQIDDLHIAAPAERWQKVYS